MDNTLATVLIFIGVIGLAVGMEISISLILRNPKDNGKNK